MEASSSRPQKVIESSLIQYAMSDGLKIDKHHAAFRFRFVDRSFVPLAYARDPGLFNAVLNVCFDPRTAKRRSFKDIMGEPKKNVQTAGKMVLTRNGRCRRLGVGGGCT